MHLLRVLHEYLNHRTPDLKQHTAAKMTPTDGTRAPGVASSHGYSLYFFIVIFDFYYI
jgi:hypothetical protein